MRIAQWRRDFYDGKFPHEQFEEVKNEIKRKISATTDFMELYHSFGDDWVSHDEYTGGQLIFVSVPIEVDDDEGYYETFPFDFWMWRDNDTGKTEIVQVDFLYIIDHEECIAKYICTINPETHEIIGSRQMK